MEEILACLNMQRYLFQVRGHTISPCQEVNRALEAAAQRRARVMAAGTPPAARKRKDMPRGKTPSLQVTPDAKHAKGGDTLESRHDPGHVQPRALLFRKGAWLKLMHIVGQQLGT